MRCPMQSQKLTKKPHKQIVRPGSHTSQIYLGHGRRHGLGQRCDMCEHLSSTHNLSQALTTGLPAQLLSSAQLRRLGCTPSSRKASRIFSFPRSRRLRMRMLPASSNLFPFHSPCALHVTIADTWGGMFRRPRSLWSAPRIATSRQL